MPPWPNWQRRPVQDREVQGSNPWGGTSKEEPAEGRRRHRSRKPGEAVHVSWEFDPPLLRIDLGPFDYGLGSGVLNSGERVRVPQGLREAQWGSSAVPVSFIR
jgi:hypothetical protein